MNTTIGRWKCEQCGNRFEREKSGCRPIRFCDLKCYHAWRKVSGADAGQFKPGFSPWNKGVKGLRLSPASEWKKGVRAGNWLPVGSETVRTDKNGKRRYFSKVAEPNIWRERAVVVWEAANGRAVRKGFVVHHRDRNSLNDDLNNLQEMSRAEHIEEHRLDLLSAKWAAE